MCNKIIVFLHFLFLINISSSYKPVILLHGIMTGAESMKIIEDLIQEVFFVLQTLNRINLHNIFFPPETSWNDCL